VKLYALRVRGDGREDGTTRETDRGRARIPQRPCCTVPRPNEKRACPIADIS
jgi:hypothetical protein